MNIATFARKIDHSAPGSCWEWAGGVDKQGYGRHLGQGAHRVSYEHFVGPVPEGMELDHLCRNIRCVNPDHLDPVTRAENMRRRYALVTHCKNGHPFDEANTYWRPEGHRDCRACFRDRRRRYLARRAA